MDDKGRAGKSKVKFTELRCGFLYSYQVPTDSRGTAPEYEAARGLHRFVRECISAYFESALKALSRGTFHNAINFVEMFNLVPLRVNARDLHFLTTIVPCVTIVSNISQAAYIVNRVSAGHRSSDGYGWFVGKDSSNKGFPNAVIQDARLCLQDAIDVTQEVKASHSDEQPWVTETVNAGQILMTNIDSLNVCAESMLQAVVKLKVQS
jgi:hypothetical protein